MLEKEQQRRLKIRSSLKLSKNQVQKKLNKILKNKDIILAENLNFWYEYFYKNLKSKIRFFCRKHKYFFEKNLNNLEQQNNCPKCSIEKNIKKTSKKRKINNFKKLLEYIKEYAQKNQYKYFFDFKWYIDNYKNTSVSNIKFICQNNHVFFKSIINLRKNSLCPICQQKEKWTFQKFISENEEKIKKIQPLFDKKWWDENYFNAHQTKLKFKCKNCNKIFKMNLVNFYHNDHGCPYCQISKGEKLIQDILEKNNIKFQREFIIYFQNKKFRFDFFLPDFNLFIEYDGVQHFQNIENSFFNFKKIKKHDFIKNKYCFIFKKQLIRIPYFYSLDEIIKIFKKYSINIKAMSKIK